MKSPHPLLASASSSTWLSIFHISSWILCVSGGAVAVWFRIQAGVESLNASNVGLIGAPIWGSIPFVITGFQAIRASNLQRYKVIQLYMIFALISFLFAIALLVFFVMEVTKVPQEYIIFQYKTICAILIFASTIEILASLISLASCYKVIGCLGKKGFHPKTKFIKHERRTSVADNTNHVTVMALPAQQAAELFYKMYRPSFKQNPLPYPDFVADVSLSQQMSRDIIRRQRRGSHETGGPEYDNKVHGGEVFDDDVDVELRPQYSRRRSRQHTPPTGQVDNENANLPPSRPYSQNRLHPVLEQEQENNFAEEINIEKPNTPQIIN